MQKPSIITVPNNKLLKPTKKIASFNSELLSQAEQMKLFLRDNADYGIGLAANQIGFDNQIFVAEFNDPEEKESIPLTFFINPKIVKLSDEKIIMEEGCLSVPKIFLPVERPEKVKIKAQDLNGKKFKLTAKGLLSRLIQHESDHLNGKIFTQLVKEKIENNFPKIKNLKIIFIGSGEFAEIILRGLILSGINISLIITETPKRAGRDKNLISTFVSQIAQDFNKKYIETNNIALVAKEIGSIKPDLIILSDFGQKISKEILEIPNIMSINIHPSLLPKYRGSTPIQSAILNGDSETGVTIMKMSEKIDTGEIIFQDKLEINKDDNAYSLKIRLANLGLKLLLDNLENLRANNFNLKKQNNKKATYTKKFKKDDGEINWNKTNIEILKQIRAYYPWPGSFTKINNKKLIIHSAEIEDNKIRIDIVQPEGKKIMRFKDFINGYRGEKPKWFEKIILR